MKPRAYRILPLLTLVAFACGVGASPLHAQTTAGVRAGASVNPDQFYFGAHLDPPPLTDRVHFRPNVEVGVGNDVTLVGLNFELAYFFPARNDWALYAGGGPALNIINTPRDTRAGGGFNILLGGLHESGLFGEVKVGVIDSPDFKFGIGYVFK